MDYKTILNGFQNELNYLIGQQTEPFHIHFMLSNYGKQFFKHDDMVELRGYYKGLKVARECLEKHIAIQEEIEEWENNDENY